MDILIWSLPQPFGMLLGVSFLVFSQASHCWMDGRQIKTERKKIYDLLELLTTNPSFSMTVKDKIWKLIKAGVQEPSGLSINFNGRSSTTSSV